MRSASFCLRRFHLFLQHGCFDIVWENAGYAYTRSYHCPDCILWWRAGSCWVDQTAARPSVSKHLMLSDLSCHNHCLDQRRRGPSCGVLGRQSDTSDDNDTDGSLCLNSCIVCHLAGISKGRAERRSDPSDGLFRRLACHDHSRIPYRVRGRTSAAKLPRCLRQI